MKVLPASSVKRTESRSDKIASMEPLPSHIRPEDAVYFEAPLPLVPMTLRALWWLGIKVLLAAQIVWIPIGLFFGINEHLREHAPELVETPFWGYTSLLLIILCILLGPLWAAWLFRAWIASPTVQRCIREFLAPSSGTH